MIEVFIYLAFLAFCVFLIPGCLKKYAAAAGWTFLVIGFLTEVPEYLTLDNFLYPALAILSVPFLAITIANILRNNPLVFQMSRAAAVAMLIFMPFTFVPLLHDALIATVVNQAVWLLNVLNYHTDLQAWNILFRNGFATEIILACTGITAMAIMLGVAAGSAKITPRQGLLAVLIVVPVIYILNIMRIVVVFIAWSDQWFAFLPDPTGTSEFGPEYASFFWAHNVFMELLSVVVLVGIAFGLFRIIPDLAVFARDLTDLYLNEVRSFVKWLEFTCRARSVM